MEEIKSAAFQFSPLKFYTKTGKVENEDGIIVGTFREIDGNLDIVFNGKHIKPFDSVIIPIE